MQQDDVKKALKLFVDSTLQVKELGEIINKGHKAGDIKAGTHAVTGPDGKNYVVKVYSDGLFEPVVFGPLL